MMRRFFRFLWVIVVLAGCAGKGTVPPDKVSPSQEINPEKKTDGFNPLPVHIFKKPEKKRAVENTLKIIDVPLDHQSNTGHFRIAIFPDRRSLTVFEPSSASASVLLQRDCQSRELLNRKIIYFDPASFALTPEDHDTLKSLVATLPKSYHLAITGFTDNRAWYQSNKSMNGVLAQLRGETVRDYFIHLGIHKKVISVNASPLCCYLATNASEIGRSRNRRAEILVRTGKRC